MHNNVFETGRGFLHEFKIQPDASGAPVARAPAGLHLPDANFAYPYPDLLFPFIDNCGQAFAELIAIPALKHIRPPVAISASTNT